MVIHFAGFLGDGDAGMATSFWDWMLLLGTMDIPRVVLNGLAMAVFASRQARVSLHLPGMARWHLVIMAHSLMVLDGKG
jgi:hypothetical protein